MDPKVFKDWPRSLQKIQDLSYTLFIDIIVLSIYRLFDPKEKRILEDMKAALQQDSIGDWFPMLKYSVIMVYGFFGFPFHAANLPNSLIIHTIIDQTEDFC